MLRLLGPRSRAGFIPHPVTGPKVQMSAVTVAPMTAGAAASGTDPEFASVAADMRNRRIAVIHTSAANALTAPIPSAVFGTIPKACKRLHGDGQHSMGSAHSRCLCESVQKVWLGSEAFVCTLAWCGIQLACTDDNQ